MKPSEILYGAADLIEPEGAWTQGATARDAAGRVVALDDGAATCWCAIGALHRARGKIWGGGVLGAENYLRRAASSRIAEWNDASHRAQAEVVSALRQAAKLAEEEGQ